MKQYFKPKTCHNLDNLLKNFFCIILCVFLRVAESEETVARIKYTLKDFVNGNMSGSNDNPVIKTFSNDEYIGRWKTLSFKKLDIFRKENLTAVIDESWQNGNEMFGLQMQEIVDLQLSKQMTNLKTLYVLTKDSLYQIDFSSDQWRVLNNVRLGVGLPSTGKLLQVTSTQLFVLTEENRILNYNTQLSEQSKSINYSYINGKLGGIKACEPMYPQKSHPSYNPAKTKNINDIYFSIWSMRGQVAVIKCKKNLIPTSCQQISLTSQMSQLEMELSDMQFNFDCTKIIYQFEQQDIYLLNIPSNSTQTYQLNQLNQHGNKYEIFDLWFMDYEDLLFGVHTETQDEVNAVQSNSGINYTEYRIWIYNISNKNLVDRYPASNAYFFVEFDIKKQQFLFQNNGNVDFYQFKCTDQSFSMIPPFYCFKCDVPCEDQNMTCSLENRACVEIKTQQQQKELYPMEKFVRYVIKRADAQSSKATEIIVALTSIFPISGYLLKYLSYWSAASVYVFLDIDMPQFLRKMLEQIYRTVNFSVFQLVNLNVNMPRLYLNQNGENEKFQKNLADTFQITSDFLLLNFQNFVICLISLLIVLILFKISKLKFVKLQKKRDKANKKPRSKSSQQQQQPIIIKSKSLFKINLKEMIVGQIISLTSVLLLGVYLIKGKRQYYNIYQKINFLLFALSLGVILVFPFLVISIDNQSKSKKQLFKSKIISSNQKYGNSSPQRSCQLQQQLHLNKRISNSISTNVDQDKKNPSTTTSSITPFFIKKMTYLCLLQYHVITPLTAFYGNIPLFMVLNFGIFLSNLCLALKVGPGISKCRKINNVVLVLWLMLIHFCMLGMVIFDNGHFYLINQLLGILCAYVIFIGALHELLSLILLDFLYDFVYVSISQKYKKINQVKDIQLRQQQAATIVIQQSYDNMLTPNPNPTPTPSTKFKKSWCSNANLINRLKLNFNNSKRKVVMLKSNNENLDPNPNPNAHKQNIINKLHSLPQPYKLQKNFRDINKTFTQAIQAQPEEQQQQVNFDEIYNTKNQKYNNRKKIEANDNVLKHKRQKSSKTKNTIRNQQKEAKYQLRLKHNFTNVRLSKIDE